MAYSTNVATKSDLTDRVRLRLRNPSYTISHDEQYENQFGYTSELFVPKWSRPARTAVFALGLLGLISSRWAKGSIQKGLGLFGVASLIRAITNHHVTNLIGWLANPSVRLKRTIRVRASRNNIPLEYLRRLSSCIARAA